MSDKPLSVPPHREFYRLVIDAVRHEVAIGGSPSSVEDASQRHFKERELVTLSGHILTDEERKIETGELTLESKVYSENDRRWGEWGAMVGTTTVENRCLKAVAWVPSELWGRTIDRAIAGVYKEVEFQLARHTRWGGVIFGLMLRTYISREANYEVWGRA